MVDRVQDQEAMQILSWVDLGAGRMPATPADEGPSSDKLRTSGLYLQTRTFNILKTTLWIV